VLVRLALDELDAVIDQVGVEVLDLLLAELDLVEPGGDLVVVENALLEAFLHQLLELFDLGERDFDGEHRPPHSRAGWTWGLDLLRHVKGPVTAPPRLTPARGGDVTAEDRTLGRKISSTQRRALRPPRRGCSKPARVRTRRRARCRSPRIGPRSRCAALGRRRP